MKKVINLLPKDKQREVKLLQFAHQQTVFWMWAIISIVVFLILTLLAKVYLGQQQAQAQSEVNAQKQILKSSDNEALKQQVEDLNSQIAGIKNLQKDHIYWSKALAELGNLFAGNISLDLLSIDRESGKIQVQGTAGSRDSVLKFWSDIHKTPTFRDIDFPLANLERATDDSFAFTFYANLDQLKQK